MKELTPRERKFFRPFFGALGFGVSCYGIYVGITGFFKTDFLAFLAIGVAGLTMLVVQISVLRNPKWPQRLW